MRHYCTITDGDYLARFLILHGSMEAHCGPYHLWALALDGKSSAVIKALPNVTVFPLAAVETKALLAAKANRTPLEYIWTAKASFVHHVLLEHPEMSCLTWIDADCMFFSDPEPIFAEIGDAPCAVVPHRFSPRCTPRTTHPGIYNGGFYHVKNNEAGLAFVEWWARSCIKWCFWRHEHKHGRDLYVDQKWLDDALQEWRAHALRHKGAHLAPWSQERYAYSLRGGRIYVDEVPLLWFHYHKGLQHGFPGIKPFVQDHIYEPYRIALGRARAKLAK